MRDVFRLLLLLSVFPLVLTPTAGCESAKNGATSSGAGSSGGSFGDGADSVDSRDLPGALDDEPGPGNDEQNARGAAPNGSDSVAGGNPISRDGTVEAASVSLTVADADLYRQTLEKHRGKVVLVDFWATWCVPCVKQFPHTLELYRRHQSDGLAVITVSMDDPNQPARVLEFLKKHGAECDNLLGVYGIGTEFAEAFQIRGDIPFYKLFDRQGTLRHQFSAEPEGLELGAPVEELDQRLAELLKEGESESPEGR